MSLCCSLLVKTDLAEGEIRLFHLAKNHSDHRVRTHRSQGDFVDQSAPEARCIEIVTLRQSYPFVRAHSSIGRFGFGLSSRSDYNRKLRSLH